MPAKIKHLVSILFVVVEVVRLFNLKIKLCILLDKINGCFQILF